MIYFTDSPELASRYALTKTDTSIGGTTEYADWFKVSVGSGKPKPLDNAWFYLDPAEKTALAKRFGDLVEQEQLADRRHWDFTLRQNRGNALAAAKELWLNSGHLFGEEETFMQVLKNSGLSKKVTWDAPDIERPGVLPVFTNAKNPLRTDNPEAVQDIIVALEEAAKGKRAKFRTDGVDAWDKRSMGIKEFLSRLKEDVKDGTSYAWVSIPDEVTEVLKKRGYDSILDMGGKGGGESHRVFIPFEENQIRSVNAAFDPEKSTSSTLLAAAPFAAVGGAGLTLAGEDARNQRTVGKPKASQSGTPKSGTSQSARTVGKAKTN